MNISAAIAGCLALGLGVVLIPVQQDSDPASPERVAEVLGHLGVSGEALAAVGVVPSEVPVFLDRVANQPAAIAEIESSGAAIILSRSEHEAAEAALRLDATDEDAITAIDTASSGLTDAESRSLAARRALLSSALSGLGDADAIGRLFLNEFDASSLPIPYRFAPESSEDTRVLEWALEAARLAEARDVRVPDDAQQAVTSADAQFDVQLALQVVGQHAASNATAIEHWMSVQP